MVRMDMERRCDECGLPMGDHRLGRDDFVCPEPKRPMREGEMSEIDSETFVINNPDGSFSLDAYAGKSREDLKAHCRKLTRALTEWQFHAMAAATDGGNSLENIREHHRTPIAALIEAYSDDDEVTTSASTSSPQLFPATRTHSSTPKLPP